MLDFHRRGSYLPSMAIRRLTVRTSTQRVRTRSRTLHNGAYFACEIIQSRELESQSVEIAGAEFDRSETRDGSLRKFIRKENER